MIALLRVISCTTLVLLQSICHHSKVLNPSHRRREHEPRIAFPNNIIVAQSNLVRLPLQLLSTFIFVALAGPNSLCYISILNPYMAYTSLCNEDKWKVFISIWYSSSEILGFVGNVLCYRKYYFCIYTLLWDIILHHPHQFVRADKYMSSVSPPSSVVPHANWRRGKAMSWQTYVDDHLMCDIDGQRLTAASIVGHDGSVWAQSELFPQVSSLILSVCFLATPLD